MPGFAALIKAVEESALNMERLPFNIYVEFMKWLRFSVSTSGQEDVGSFCRALKWALRR